MASLASYVWTSRHPFAPGHLMDLRGPIRVGSPSAITAAVIVADPGLAPLDGPFGRVEFLQVVGLTATELELCRAWNADGVADLLARQDGLLVTRLDRADLTSDPDLAAEVADRAAADGSALHELRVASLKLRRRWRGRADVQMGAGAAAALGPALRRELVAGGASFVVVGDESSLRFVLADSAGWHWTEDGIEARVVPDGVEYVAGLFDGRTGWGHASDWPKLRFHVVK
jgi:suppressor of fused-like protein